MSPGQDALRVDQGLCMGTGVCLSLAPEHFELVDGVSHYVGEAPLPPPDAEEVIESCPMAAITPSAGA